MINVNSQNNDIRKTCANLLTDVLNKKITAQDAIAQWPQDTGDELLDNIYSELFHYKDDEDIRKKDHRYEIWQNDEMKKMIKCLKRQRIGE